METYFYKYYRPLNAIERKRQVDAIRWLLKKKVRMEQIKTLTYRSVDQEREALKIRYDTKIGIFMRYIPYQGTPLEPQIKHAKETSKSSLFLFPKRAWKGRRPTYCPAYRDEELRELIGKKRTWKFVWTKA